MSKNNVVQVFDSLAETKAWESLYNGKIDRRSFNFVARQRAVEELLAPVTKGQVLDLGCGTGDLLPFYASKGVRYTGLDISEKMVARAKERHSKLLSEGKIEFVVGDCEKLPYESGQFDVVSAVAVLEYVPDGNRMLDEMTRVLKPGGALLLTVPHKSCINFKIRDLLAPFRNALFPLYRKMTGSGLNSMSEVKHYHYDPEELDPMIEERGLKKTDKRFSNFYAIPHPLDHLVPKTYMTLSETIEHSSWSDRMRRLAVNYIALYVKK